jgi:hypothetical protein
MGVFIDSVVKESNNAVRCMSLWDEAAKHIYKDGDISGEDLQQMFKECREEELG